MSPPNITTADQIPVSNSRASSLSDFAMDGLSYGYAMPVFGGDGFNRSPSVMMDDSFLNSLFTVA